MHAHLPLMCFCILGAALPCHAGGLFRRVPEVGEWARYDLEIQYSVPMKEEDAPGPKLTGTLTLKCVGEETINDVRHLWIESRSEFPENGSNEELMILKFLVPAEHVIDDDLVEYVVRGWGQYGTLDVYELNLNGDFFFEDPLNYVYLLTFPISETSVGVRQNKTVRIDGEEVELTHNESGALVTRDYEGVQIEGEATWWPSTDHAFGVAAVTQRMTVDVPEPFESVESHEVQMNLTETGTDTVSDLPTYN